MTSFAEAVQRVDATGVPVVEGMAVQFAEHVDAEAAVAQVAARLPGTGWTATRPAQGRWWVLTSGEPGVLALPEAWEAVRKVRGVTGVTSAVRLPPPAAAIYIGYVDIREVTAWSFLKHF